MAREYLEKHSDHIRSWWHDLRPAALPLPLPLIYQLIAFGTTYGLNPVPQDTSHLTMAEAWTLARQTTREYRVVEGALVLTLAILYFGIQEHLQRIKFDPNRKLLIDKSLPERDRDFLCFLNGD